jgi:hypothetical protein
VPLTPVVTDPTAAHRIVIGHVPTAIRRALRLAVETVMVPTALLWACVHTIGAVWGFAAILAWCAAVLLVRRLRGGPTPGTLLVVCGVLAARTAASWAMSSLSVYLLAPVVGSLVMAALFLGSAALGRPVTLRLAQDFVHLPATLLHDRRIRRMFTQISILWGISRLADAGLSIGTLHLGTDAALLSRGLLSGLLTAASIAACAAWGVTRLRRSGIHISTT